MKRILGDFWNGITCFIKCGLGEKKDHGSPSPVFMILFRLNPPLKWYRCKIMSAQEVEKQEPSFCTHIPINEGLHLIAIKIFYSCFTDLAF